MPQDEESGRGANALGHKMAKLVADKLGLQFTGHPSSNKCIGANGVCLIKTASKGNSYIGVLKSMLPELNAIYAVIGTDHNIFQIYEIKKIKFDKLKREPAAERNKHLWFMKVKDIIASCDSMMKLEKTQEPSSHAATSPPQKERRTQIDHIDSNIYELFNTYNNVLSELETLGIIRSKNNPVGDYGEYIAEKMLHLTRAPKSAKGFDLIDSQGKKYQVKTRRPTPGNPSRQLGGFRDLEETLFDSCLAIILSPNFEPKEMWEIPHEVIYKYARETTRGFKRVVLDGSILNDVAVKRLL